MRCIAAGIYDDTGKLVAGLSISAPADRLQDRLARPTQPDGARDFASRSGIGRRPIRRAS